MRKLLIYAVVLIMLVSYMVSIPTPVVAERFPYGLTLEAGSGYSQLLWQVDSLNGDRTAFSLSPAIRLGYRFGVGGNFSIYPFTGYSRFGGKSKVESNGYYDYYWFNIWETGLIGSYQYRDFSFGPGLKYNRHLKVYGKYYGTLLQPAGTTREWTTEDWLLCFKKQSFDLGLRTGWGYRHFVVAGEAWFGLTQLEEGIMEEIGARVHQRQFRMMLGIVW